MERVLKLLRREPSSPDTSRGYLDLIGGRSPTAKASLAQRLMNSTALPLVYENVWRPALIGLAKGPFGPSADEEMALLRELLDLSEGDVVLDVACGPGNVARALAPHAGLVIGLDASATMLDRAVGESARFLYRDRLEFVRADAVDLPFETGSFDAVSCVAALHLFDRPFDALASMARVLKPGGRLAILTTRRVTVVSELVRLGGVRMFGGGEIAGALAELGFHDVRRRAFGLMQLLGARA
ncbi:class I SAM-dependent methyltransferase [Thermoactinospora rubra]|uniref:class I SAM-dependent methyltransferase n=1 Tax=Thermoactinospora rubra TaxID=1088767 RepID=UPI000A106B62|nr:methyltransferase domain-containing protein [Thermoactinospora rubra]